MTAAPVVLVAGAGAAVVPVAFAVPLALEVLEVAGGTVLGSKVPQVVHASEPGVT